MLFNIYIYHVLVLIKQVFGLLILLLSSRLFSIRPNAVNTLFSYDVVIFTLERERDDNCRIVVFV